MPTRPHQKVRRRRLTDMEKGLAHILNNPAVSNDANKFRQIIETPTMSVNQLLGYIGKKSGLPKKPNDDDRSQQRLSQLEENSHE